MVRVGSPIVILSALLWIAVMRTGWFQKPAVTISLTRVFPSWDVRTGLTDPGGEITGRSNHDDQPG